MTNNGKKNNYYLLRFRMCLFWVISHLQTNTCECKHKYRRITCKRMFFKVIMSNLNEFHFNICMSILAECVYLTSVRINSQQSPLGVESGPLIQLCHVWSTLVHAKRWGKTGKMSALDRVDKWMTSRMASCQRAGSRARTGRRAGRRRPDTARATRTRKLNNSHTDI